MADQSQSIDRVICCARDRGTTHVCLQPLGRTKSGGWGHMSMPRPWWPHAPKPKVVNA